MTLKLASLGSVSTATLRPEDLLSAFLHELQWHVNRNGDFYSIPENFSERDRLNGLVGESQDCFAADGESIDPDKEDEALDLIIDLEDALQVFAPPYCYFGAHPGDGADFGFWPSHDLIDELPTVEDGAEASKEEDCKTVNDHGNVTVWSNGKIVLEIV